MKEAQRFSTTVGRDTITIETGKLAGQANGAVTVRLGDTIILTTATMARTPREGIDFFPLSVEYEERLYAAGRIPGSFFRREGRPGEASILICRLTDRPLRPLFPDDFRNDVQVVITSLSSDGEHQIDILAINGASAALTISDIPFHGPVGAVRVGYIDGAARGQSHRVRDGSQHARSAHCRHPRRHPHGRVRRERDSRRPDGGSAGLRPQGAAADDRSAEPDARSAGQAQERNLSQVRRAGRAGQRGARASGHAASPTSSRRAARRPTSMARSTICRPRSWKR